MQTEEARANQSRPAGGFQVSHIQNNKDKKEPTAVVEWCWSVLMDSWQAGKLVKVAGECQSLRAEVELKLWISTVQV